MLPSIGRFRDVVFFDTEYEALEDDDPRLPRLVCVQWCTLLDPTPRLARWDEAREIFEGWIRDPRILLAGLYVEADTRICARTYGLEREVWAAYEDGRVSCAFLREKMIDLARPGEVRWSDEAGEDDDRDEAPSPSKGRRFRYVLKLRWNAAAGRPEGYGKRSSYGMAAIGARRFGWDLSADKGADGWRKRYVELIDTPVAEWPEDARRYALEDATRTREIWLAQAARPKARPLEHLETGWWERLHPRESAPLLSGEAARTHYAYCLQVMRETGFAVDRARVAETRAQYDALEAAARDVLRSTGILDPRVDRISNLQAARRGLLSAEQTSALLALEAAHADAVTALQIAPPPAGRGAAYTAQREARAAAKAHEEEARRALRAWEREPWQTSEREVIDREELVAQVLAAYAEHPEIYPSLNKTGLRDFGEYEGRPLASWPPEVRERVDTSGPSLRALVGPTSDDARTLARDPAAARAWDPDRIRAGLTSSRYPALLANATANYAHAMSAGMLAPLESCEVARPRFDSLLETGRISLAGSIRQNMPRKGGIRECFVPRPGHALIVADFAQIELVAFAFALDRAVEHVRGYPAGSYQGPLTRAINAGLDCHLLLALDLLPADVRAQVTYADAVTAGLVPADEAGRIDAKALRKRLGGLAEEYGGSVGAAAAARPGEPWGAYKAIEAARQQSKAVNYGLPGGMSARTFSRTQTKAGSPVSVARAEVLAAAWNARWEPTDYFALVRAILDEAAPLGAGVEVPASDLVLGGRTYCQVANVFFQGPTAEGFRRALTAVMREMLLAAPGDALHGARCLLPVHDEIVAEAPLESAKAALARMQALMVEGMGSVFPGMRVETSGAVLTDRWRKT